MSKQYLDKRGLQTLCNSLKTLINSKPGYEYSSISVTGGTTTQFMINDSQYCKLILESLTTDSANYLKVYTKNNTGTINRLVANISGIDIDFGIEVEVLGSYIFVKVPSLGTVYTNYRGGNEKIVFEYNSDSSSDNLDFAYRLEV